MWLTGLVAPRHVGSSQTRARTRVFCIGRRILNHCATREAPLSLLRGASIEVILYVIPLYAGHVGRFLVLLAHRLLDQKEPHPRSCTPGDSATSRPAACYEIKDFEPGVMIGYYFGCFGRGCIFHMWEGCASLGVEGRLW